MFPIHDFSALEIAFPANVIQYMPRMEDIPKEFTDWPSNNKFGKFFADMFYNGVRNIKLTPKEGVDKTKAFAHIRAIAGSFDPKHEHKEAACAFLMSEWFEDVQWERAKKEPRR